MDIIESMLWRGRINGEFPTLPMGFEADDADHDMTPFLRRCLTNRANVQGLTGLNRRSVPLAQAWLRRMWFGALEPQGSGHLLCQPECDSGFTVCVAADLEILHSLAVRETLRFLRGLLQDWVARDG